MARQQPTIDPGTNRKSKEESSKGKMNFVTLRTEWLVERGKHNTRRGRGGADTYANLGGFATVDHYSPEPVQSDPALSGSVLSYLTLSQPARCLRRASRCDVGRCATTVWPGPVSRRNDAASGGGGDAAGGRKRYAMRRAVKSTRI